MPKKPKRPCAYPGCGRLTNGRYCDEHRQLAEKQYNRYLRDPDTNRRYGRAWKKLRARFLLLHPLCEQCRDEGRLTPAEEMEGVLLFEEAGDEPATDESAGSGESDLHIREPYCRVNKSLPVRSR